MTFMPEEMVPRRIVADEFHRDIKTVKRWEARKVEGFDEPIEINGRIYHKRSKIEGAKAGARSLKYEKAARRNLPPLPAAASRDPA
jgi:hypothetical protein